MAIRGVEKLEEALKKHNGNDAVISISHKLYGNQKIKCKLDYILDEQRIGFRVKSGQEIYLYKYDVQKILIDTDLCFSDDIMDIKVQIKKTENFE